MKCEECETTRAASVAALNVAAELVAAILKVRARGKEQDAEGVRAALVDLYACADIMLGALRSSVRGGQ